MKRAVKIMAVVQVVLVLAIAALLLFSDGARERFAQMFGGGEKSGEASAVRGAGGNSGDEVAGKADSAKSGKATGKTVADSAAIRELLKSGRVDDAEVERRVAEIIETKKRTIEVKRAEEERRIGEVADWFDHLMAAHPESGAKAREILNEYIELRYNTYGDMEDVDPEFARAQRESVRQHVGQRLMSELPPAQGATVMKQLFI
jgi:hypothetical protein